MKREIKSLSFGSLMEILRSHCADLPEPRSGKNIRYSLSDIVISTFACMYFRDPSMLQFQKRMQDKKEACNFTNLFGVKRVPEATQLREVLDQIPSSSFNPLFKEVFTRLQRSNQLGRFSFYQGKYFVSIDGSGYYQSKNVSCSHCLTKERKSGKSYSHQTLQGAIVNPDMKQVLPIIAEDIRNEDGNTKQDCEQNAAKRLIAGMRKQHPRLECVIVGDSLFSQQPMIEVLREHRMNFIFTAKPGNHKYMMAHIESVKEQLQTHVIRSKNETRIYRWMEDVPLGGREDTLRVNYFELEIHALDKKTGRLKKTFRSSWVTDLELSEEYIAWITRAARARWKIENECFNNLKNQGYHLEHNFGHGEQFLAFNLYILTLLAFLIHQIFEMTDPLYQEARRRWSKNLMWENIRGAVRFLLFESWTQMLNHCLDPPDIISTAKT